MCGICYPKEKYYVNNRLVSKAREGVLEFLLINHPLDCPVCDQGGECDLQDLSLIYGGDRGRYYEYKRAVEDKFCGSLIKTVMTRCIHCTRCIRFLVNLVGVYDLGMNGRGLKSEIGTYISNTIKSELSGNIIDICPVGALTNKPYSFKGRSWELDSNYSIDIFDTLCSNIRVDYRGTDLLRIVPRLNEKINEDWISDKIRFFFDSLNIQRLIFPLEKVNVENKMSSFRYLKKSWSNIFLSIQNRINIFFIKKKLTKKLQLNNLSLVDSFINYNLFTGSLVDSETLIILKDLFNKLGSNNFIFNFRNKIDKKINNDFRSYYLTNFNFNYLKSLDFCLLLFLNLRLESPVLNLRLRKIFIKNDTFIFNLGVNSNLNYRSYNLGNNLNLFFSIIKEIVISVIIFYE